MKKPIVRYLIIIIAVMALWGTILLKPLKNFMLFFHKLGHTLTGLMFGYGINDFNEGGAAFAQINSWIPKVLIISGGYLGSILFALLILYLKRTSFKKYILGSTAILFLLVSIQFPGFGITLLYASIFAVFVIALYMLQNENVNDWIIDIIGLSSIAYVIYDTLVNTIFVQLNHQFGLIKGWAVNQPQTDAIQLAELTHIPAAAWGVVWIVAALFAVNAIQSKRSKGRR